MKKVKIYDFDIDCFKSLDHAVKYITVNCLDSTNIAVAINPEKILSAISNQDTYEALALANIRYLDGIGTVKLAEKKLEEKLSRIPGCELWEKLMIEVGHSNIPVFILGANNETVEKTVYKLRNEYNVEVVGYHDGYFSNDAEMIKTIINSKPKILSVALGSPRQEIFMKKCKDSGADFFMMGVGGTYNVFTNSVKRAPESWCRLNLEWLYRLLSEPTRIKRQLKLLKFVELAYRGKI
ncbi:TPA: WecB/TagA/CpsF family glycosyltransferase [Photobacterium damselae]